MNKLKQLTEKHAALLAQSEKLDATKAEERQKLDGLIAEIKETDAAIATEVELQSIKSRAAPALSRQEQRDFQSFDLGRLLRHMKSHARGAHSVLDGVEAEMVREGEREARAMGIESSGVILPRVLVRRAGYAPQHTRALNATGTSDQGGTLIATEKRGLADDFFDQSVIRQAGATVIEGLVGNIDLPRLHASTDKPKGKGETESADELKPTFAQLSLSPKRLSAYIPFTDQLARQNSDSIEALIRKYLTDELLAKQEAAFFHGTGVKEPTGLATTAGIGSVVSAGGNGAITWKSIIALKAAVDVQNALQGNLHYITNSSVCATLQTTLKDTNTSGIYLLGDTGGTLAGYQPLFTNAISNKLGGGNDRSALFFGNWSDYIIGYWGGLELEVVRDVEGAKTGTSTVVISAFYDGGVLRPKSFSAQLDIKA